MSDTLWGYVNNPAQLGAFLRNQRLQRGITQDQLAEDLGITRQYLVDLEKGRPTLYSKRLFALLRLLGARLKVEAGA